MRYSILVGKSRAGSIFEKAHFFQAVAQVNPTVQNTLLLGPHFSSFFVSGFILSYLLSLKWLLDCIQRLFFVQ
jgi:hypothetical protein